MKQNENKNKKGSKNLRVVFSWDYLVVGNVKIVQCRQNLTECYK